MTIRFAAARHRVRYGATSTKAYGNSAPAIAANDNALIAANDDVVLTSALRFFADHGLCAARRAGDEAESAFAAGDSAGFDWWLSVCRMLDRRLADAVATRTSLAP